MSKSPINFIQKVSPTAYKHYDLAYRHCYEDPENSLVKLRAYALVLVDLLYQHFDVEADEKATLYDKTNARNIQSWMPYFIREKLNYLRIQGNRGAHPESSFRSPKIARNTAIIALQTAYKITLWVYETLELGATEKLPDFTPPTAAQSDKLYGDAVIRHDVEAQYSVGMIFKQRADNAPSTDKSNINDALEDARYWLQKATDQGHAAAMFQLGELYRVGSHILRAEQLIRNAARLGNAHAQHRLGVFLLEGRLDAEHSYESNPQHAFQCFKQAADQEHLAALNRLVEMYYEGIGVDKDPEQAFSYAYKAAEAGYPSAQFKLAHLYQMGVGIKQNDQQAFHWYQQAAQAGDADAQVVMFKYYSNGFVVEKNLLQAIEWLQLAEVQEHAGAAYYLGLAYRRGIGVKIDIVRALNLFKRCIDLDTSTQYAAARAEFTQGIELIRQQAKHAAQNRNRPQFVQQTAMQTSKIKRNDPCPCGSGKKYKKCCQK